MEGLVVKALISKLGRALFGLVALAAAAALASPAAAWDETAHRVVADLAYARLTPAAKAQVDVMIAQAAVTADPSCPVASLADAAAYPDCVDGIRRFNEMRRWHDEAQPVCPAQARGDPCKDGQCTRAAVKRAIGVLAAPAEPPATRVYALEQLAHFMADLHQPTDQVDNRDDFGRDLRVTLPGSSDKRLNLHDFWNDQLPAVAVGSESLGVRYLAPIAARGKAWEAGDVDAWANETTTLGRAIYAGLPQPPECGRTPRSPEALSRAYVQAAVPVAREQLAKAAVRLAAVLNATLR
jgi:hypothetical protein